ncbi:MAG: hypothetical protein NPINA01_07580 [Nitrospinaceae bacterium]|nr:MAG: hypothetical protein NPINA01_07580 [Nitrospinaceae bacterium]
MTADHDLRGKGMDEEGKSESEKQTKRKVLNIYLLIFGVLLAGVSFAWHILSLLFKE